MTQPSSKADPTAEGVLRVVIAGAESTGKTTLAQRLAEHYQTCWAKESGRAVLEAKMAQGPVEWTTQDFMDIVMAKVAQEDEMAARCHRLLICDTDGFGTAIWHEKFMGFRSLELESLVEKRRRPDLYLVPELAAMPFVQDGTRDEEKREWMFKTFIERLRASRRNFSILMGDYEAVFQHAVSVIDKLLKSQSTTSSRDSPT